LDHEKQTQILLFQKNHDILYNLAIPLNDLHYNGNGRYSHVRDEIDNSRHPAKIQRRYHNKSTDHSIVFLPKGQNRYHRNGNARLELLLLSFYHMSLQIPLFYKLSHLAFWCSGYQNKGSDSRLLAKKITEYHTILILIKNKVEIMSKISKLKNSRDTWKTKAVDRAKALRYQKTQKARIKQEREKYKSQARELKRELEKERKKNTHPVCHKEELIYISLNLFLVGHIGFRAISRLLGVLKSHIGIAKVPCPQTIINWVIRYSLTKIWNYNPPAPLHIANEQYSNGSIWIIDTSIGLGAGKILAVLELKVNHHEINEGAPTLQNINCVAISVSRSWTGEAIANFLQKIITVTGTPVAYLKDGGTDLAKAVRILDKRGLSSLAIDDISHTIANLLKHEYQKHPMFDTFISGCGKASKKLKQTILACFAPPKVSTKARFMNIHRLVKWADMFLKHSPRGRVSKKSVFAKLRACFAQLPECKSFISRFLRDAIPLLESQKILKNRGLNLETYKECKGLMKTIPQRSSVRKGFIVWMEKQLMISDAIGLGNIGMTICSDNIESLFGLGKQHGTGEIKDANRIALRLPAFCGEVTKKSAQMVMSTSVKEQREIENQLSSLAKQRRKLLSKPGMLDETLTAESDCNLCLIPRPKNDSKTYHNKAISSSYEKETFPAKGQGKRTDSLCVPTIIKALAA
jgi:hypothetical protein